MTIILGIETSCDETAAAVVSGGRHILSNVVASQIDLHRPFGGVFPEVASREHMVAIHPVIRKALDQAGVDLQQLDAIAVTCGPGLAGSLLVGVNVAKGLAWAQGLPLVGVNHLEGHVYSNWLETDTGAGPPTLMESEEKGQAFPLLVLIVSGGHSELVLMREHGNYQRLGATIDDAAGEAFDKVARLLGLSYPGGPAIQQAAKNGDPGAFNFPRGLTGREDHLYDFSFSGLKTAVLRQVREIGDGYLPVPDLAASFQESVVDVLVEKTRAAASAFDVKQVCVCGGVAANARLRERLQARLDLPVRVPPLALCTDNGAMIAAAGTFRYWSGNKAGWDLDVFANLRLT